MYIVIGKVDDDLFIESLSKDELESRIKNDFYKGVTFLSEIPTILLRDWPTNTAYIVRAAAAVVPLPL